MLNKYRIGKLIGKGAKSTIFELQGSKVPIVSKVFTINNKKKGPG